MAGKKYKKFSVIEAQSLGCGFCEFTCHEEATKTQI